MRHTLVCFHAHPDDESLLTGGVIAGATAAGHRVVVVVATLGEADPSTPAHPTDLGERRQAELAEASSALGVHRLEWLGYADSGMAGAPSGAENAFARTGVEEAAVRLAGILHDERCDVLTVYDAAGGYGHPDHVQVHRVGVRAAELTATPVVLEATVDRAALLRASRLLDRLPYLRSRWSRPEFHNAYTEPGRLTHEVDVRPHLHAKRAAMVAHASQASRTTGVRTLAVLSRLPGPLFAAVAGREWFVERGRTPTRPLRSDIFASLDE